jgi:hypothetical protein
MNAEAYLESLRFHFQHAWFNAREQFSDIPAGLVANALIPFFVWILSHIWQRFNGAQSQLTLSDVIIYIGFTELLFMTFLRVPSLTRASADFSISLARPRSWLATSFSGLVGRSLGGRFFMLALLLPSFPFLGARWEHALHASFRLVLLLPWLAVVQGLFALLLSIAQVLWDQTKYFLMPIGKIFLVLGGVLGPIVDFSEPWRQVIINAPPSDLFFQPAYFCVTGAFYGMTVGEWLLRTALLAGLLFIVSIFSFRYARAQHQAFGG